MVSALEKPVSFCSLVFFCRNSERSQLLAQSSENKSKQSNVRLVISPSSHSAVSSGRAELSSPREGGALVGLILHSRGPLSPNEVQLMCVAEWRMAQRLAEG